MLDLADLVSSRRFESLRCPPSIVDSVVNTDDEESRPATDDEPTLDPPTPPYSSWPSPWLNSSFDDDDEIDGEDDDILESTPESISSSLSTDSELFNDGDVPASDRLVAVVPRFLPDDEELVFFDFFSLFRLS